MNSEWGVGSLFALPTHLLLLILPPLLLEMQGAVSTEVARGLAEGIRIRMNTTVGIGVTGESISGKSPRGFSGLKGKRAGALAAADAARRKKTGA